jgi:ribosomal protein L21
MYAIFRAAGKQFRAEKGKTLRLPLMSAEAGSKITFDEVLLSSDGETIKAGAPLVKGAQVLAEVVGAGQGAQDLRVQVQAAEELPSEDRASAEVYRSSHYRRQAGLRRIWHIRRV